jgi:hypothetical protein
LLTSPVGVITGTTISNNSVNATTGNARGAVFMAAADATVTFRNSTISGNSLSTGSATAQGGAIANTGGSVFVLSNTTVTNNSAKIAGGLSNWRRVDNPPEFHPGSQCRVYGGPGLQRPHRLSGA